MSIIRLMLAPLTLSIVRVRTAVVHPARLWKSSDKLGEMGYINKLIDDKKRSVQSVKIVFASASFNQGAAGSVN